jgi:four helix bundle protein
MGKYQSFEDLPVWQESAQLYNQVLDLIEDPQSMFSPGLRNQLDRAALAVSSQVCQAYEHNTTESRPFLAAARAAASEVRSIMVLIKDRPKCRPLTRQLHEIRDRADACVRQIRGWMLSMDKPRGENRAGKSEPGFRGPQRAGTVPGAEPPASAGTTRA